MASLLLISAYGPGVYHPPKGAILIKESKRGSFLLAKLVAVQIIVQNTIVHDKPLVHNFPGSQAIANRLAVWLGQWRLYSFHTQGYPIGCTSNLVGYCPSISHSYFSGHTIATIPETAFNCPADSLDHVQVTTHPGSSTTDALPTTALTPPTSTKPQLTRVNQPQVR